MRYGRIGCAIVAVCAVAAVGVLDPLLPESYLWANWTELPTWVQESWLETLSRAFSVYSVDNVMQGRVPAVKVIIWFPDLAATPFIYPGILMVAEANQSAFPERVLYAYKIGYLVFGSWIATRAWER